MMLDVKRYDNHPVLACLRHASVSMDYCLLLIVGKVVPQATSKNLSGIFRDDIGTATTRTVVAETGVMTW